MIGGNHKQRRIQDLLRQASANSDKDEDDVPRLVRREPRDRSLPARLGALDSLTRIRGGLGRPTRTAVKRLLAEIRAFAQDDQELLNRADEIESRLKSVRINREKKKQAVREQTQLTEVEQEKLLAEAKEPFSVIRGSVWDRDGFEWQGAIVDGHVAWRLIAPVKFEVITRRELNAEQTTVEVAAVESVESAAPISVNS